VHLGFGEARLPVPAAVAEALGRATAENAYGAVTGERGLRESVAAWLGRRGTPTDPDQVMVTPGSKAALYALLTVLPGDLVLPRPSWVSYAAQGHLLGKRIVWCDVPPSAGGIPDPTRLVAELDAAVRAGLDPSILVLTIPDNPTGTQASSEETAAVMEVAAARGLVVVVDEIYRDLSYDPSTLPATVEMLPERTFLTTGLSKSLSLGGWRIGLLRVPARSDGAELMSRLEAVASEIWSCVSAPIAAAARVAFDEPPAVRAYIADARAAHRTLATSVFDCLVRLGCDCRAPTAAFYLYPGFEGRIRARDDRELQERLLTEAGIAALPGSAFGDDPARLRLRLATSFLCGETAAERRATLEAASSGELLELPHVRLRLAQIESSLGRLIDG
jgi:aspartate aminotransferase